MTCITRAAAASAATHLVRLTLCRGCCCGTEAQRPQIDHVAQRDRVEALAAAGVVRVRVSDCLGPCFDANVLVVQPAPAARAAGARPVWLGLPDDDHLELALAWVVDGGPGRAPLPAGLAQLTIPRDRR